MTFKFPSNPNHSTILTLYLHCQELVPFVLLHQIHNKLKDFEQGKVMKAVSKAQDFTSEQISLSPPKASIGEKKLNSYLIVVDAPHILCDYTRSKS